MTHSWLLLAVSAVVFAPFARGAIYDNVADLPKTSYDFIIVGASPAGSVVANRVTENTNFSVLLLEAGGLTADDINSEVPGYASRAQASHLNWNFTSAPMAGANDRAIRVSRARGLGGSTIFNGMAATRGSRWDWDRYGSTTGDESWLWDNIQPYFRKNEKWSEPADRHNTSGQYDPKVHSLTGLTSVSLAGYLTPSTETIAAAVDEQNATSPFRFNLDYNSGDPLGMAYTQATISSTGHRSSAAVSYLADEYVARPNFDVLINARVTRVLPVAGTDASKNDTPQFGQVEFSDGTETLHIVSASKEIILSAGGIMTSSVLLHSGIGPAAELSALGITPVHDLPNVGKDMSEHSFVYLPWSKNSTSNVTVVPPTDEELFEEWQAGSGPLVGLPVSHIGYARLGDPEQVKLRYNLTEDPAPGEQSPHIEYLFCTNPLDEPIIDLNLMGSAFDLAAMRDAVRLTYQFFASPAWEGFSPMALDINDDDALDHYIKAGVVTSFHAVGTTGMSKDGSSGVVGSDLLVNGVRGLRVVDVGVLPYLIAGHTSIPAYVIGERAADFIKAAW